MKKLVIILVILAGFAMQLATSVHAQQIDLYYAGVKNDTLAVVYKNNELLYSNLEPESWCCSATDLAITTNGDVYYVGGGNYGANIWKNGELFFKGDYRSIIKGCHYNESENVLYSVGEIYFGQRLGVIWRGDVIIDTLGTSWSSLNDIDFMDGHIYTIGSNHRVNGVADLTIWKDGEPLYVLGNDWDGMRTIVCHDGHVYACGALRTDIGPFSYNGIIWKDGEELYNYGSYANVRDFCIDGDDIYACGEINVENQEQKAMVWKNGEVLYEYDYDNFISFCAILKVEKDLYFGGAGYYYGKQPNEMLNSYGVLFKNGENIEIDPECTGILALAVSSKTNALPETANMPLVVFPNPADRMVNIEGIEPVRVQVYNSFGQLVSVFSNINRISIEGLSEGIYLLRITDKEGNSYLENIVKK